MREENLGCLKFIGAQRDMQENWLNWTYTFVRHTTKRPNCCMGSNGSRIENSSTNVGDVAVHLRNSGSV